MKSANGPEMPSTWPRNERPATRSWVFTSPNAAIAEPMRSRWSPSIFDGTRRLTVAEVGALLNAARWAPSAGNTQPWRFVVAERGDATHRLLVPHLSRGNSGWVPRASVVFLAATEVQNEHGQPLEGKFDASSNIYSLGQAVAHLTLQAQAMDLWAHQFSGFDRTAVAADIQAPPQIRIVAAIAVGHRGNPDDAPEHDRQREQKERRRHPLATIAFGASWGEPWTPLETQIGDRSLSGGCPASDKEQSPGSVS